jgi:riboflavin kinase
MEIKGVVSSGVGEGKWYVEKYLPYFEQTLGFTCFPGTLNMKVAKALDFDGAKKITVTPEEKDLVAVDCYLVMISGVYDGAVVIPRITRHGKEIVELIAAVNLREELKLKDGDEVACELV